MTVIPKTAPFARYCHIVDDWNAFQETLQRPLPTTIWTNTLRTTPEALAHSLAKEGIALRPIPWYPGGFILPENIRPGRLWQQFAGLYHIQEATSMMPVRLLDPQPGERVLDMCAAPGNKTVQMAVAMRNTGTIYATDISNGRLRVLRLAINRLGITNIAVSTSDATSLGKQTGQFDRILVDAPCSCEGTSRRSPHLLTAEAMPTEERKTGTQLALLRKAVQLCKPGGRIVYSTCTYAPEENEMIVDAILKEASQIITLRSAELPGVQSTPGVTEWQGTQFHPSLHLARRMWPHQNDSGGFFVAVLEKSAAAPEDETVLKPITAESGKVWGKAVEPEPWLTIIHERFGIPHEQLDPMVLIRWSKRGAFIASANMTPPRYRPPDNIGLFFMRTTDRLPKLTTAATMLVGQWAQKNVVDLTDEQAVGYFLRETRPLLPQQTHNCTSTGYVIVRYKGIVLGLGFYWAAQADKPHRLEGLYPKNWAARPDNIGI
ncbi:MAG: hypothetical protein Kow0080_03280 [Candidatus Promineifilaceae bacterium]